MTVCIYLYIHTTTLYYIHQDLINLRMSQLKCLLSVAVKQTGVFQGRCGKDPSLIFFTKIRPVGARWFHADAWKGRQGDMTPSPSADVRKRIETTHSLQSEAALGRRGA